MKHHCKYLHAWQVGRPGWYVVFFTAILGGTLRAADVDNDRMDDSYEITHGLAVGVDDRHGDKDGDGFPNLAEYLKNTSASDAGSVPTADRMVGTGETYTTISSALASLTADDQIIVVKPGVYAESVGNTGAGAKRVFIISESVDPNITTLKPASGSTISSSKDLYLRGFTLSSAGGNGVGLTGSGSHGIVQCVLHGHSHGIYSQPASSSARNFVDVIGSIVLNGSGSGIYGATNASTFRLVHTTICGQASYAIYNSTSGGGGSTYTLTNCVMWNNGSSEFSMSGGAVTATYSCIKGSSVYSGTGNIRACY
ncbi:MAG: hypothetical protein CJBNEKGG_03342 [Prosthecobacter sp.]|nr:hypothetical protein [Prosthecobacter sp.]